MVAKYNEMQKFMESEQISAFEMGDVRSRFFFGQFFSELATESGVEVYAADHARIP